MTLSRKTIILLALAILLVIALFFVFSNFARVQEYFKQQKLQAEIKELGKPYREDIYGGSTPEETYALFIKALKEGNIELAAKYFSPKRQADWLKELQAQKEQNKLDKFINALPKIDETEKPVQEDQGVAEFEYTRYREEYTTTLPGGENSEGVKHTFPAGPYVFKVLFVKNTFTNKWKIESL